QQAGVILSRAIEAVPECVELLERHGEIFMQEGRPGEAAEQFIVVARRKLESGRLDEARRALERALRAVPEHLEARELLADVLAHEQAVLQAIGIYCDLAEFSLRDGDAEAVIRITSKILQLDPDHLPTLLMLAKVYGRAGNVEKQRQIQMRLIELYKAQQAWSRAADICEEILARQEDCMPALEELVAIAEAEQQVHRA